LNNLRHIFLIILWITSLGTQAQTTFEKLYSYPLKQIGVQGIQLSQGYLISTKIDDCGPCDGYIQFIRIDDSGDTIRTFNIPNLGNEQGPVSTLFLNDQHLVIAANNTNGITNQVALINSDTLGNIFWSYVLSDPLYDYSANAMIKIDSNYLITGMRSVPGSPQLTRTFLLSVSKAGNFNWLNSYGNPYENFATGLRLQNEEVYITGSMFDTVRQKVQPFIFKTDTAGNLFQFNEIILASDAAPTGIAGDAISNYVYGYTIDSLQNINSLLIRLDLNLDTMWTSMVDQGRNETVRCGIPNEIGGITLSTSVSSSGNTGGDILLCKYDSTGSTVFMKTINGFNNEPFSSSLIQTQDLGFLIVTTSYNNLNHSSACAFKTDSLGEIITTISSSKKSPLEIYPNPSNGIIHFDNDSKILKIEIINLHGKILKQFKESAIDITGYENGIYIFKVYLEFNMVVYGKLIKED